MAIGHISVRPHSRGAGHTAAAALAYRHGQRLVDCRTGAVHDYRHRDGCEHALAADGIVAPECWTGSLDPKSALQPLADAIEMREKHPRARILRDVQAALPCELDEAQRAALARDFARELSGRYGTVVSYAVHRPSWYSDERNHHVHCVLPTRTLDEDGEFSAKLRQLDDLKQGPSEIAEIRGLWERTANAALEQAGHFERVRTGRRLDAEPEPTAPRGAPAAGRAAHAQRTALHRFASRLCDAAYAPHRDTVRLARARSEASLERWARQLRQRIADSERALARIRETLRLAARWAAVRERLEAVRDRIAGRSAEAAAIVQLSEVPDRDGDARAPPEIQLPETPQEGSDERQDTGSRAAQIERRAAALERRNRRAAARDAQPGADTDNRRAAARSADPMPQLQ